jgi:cysteine synthase
MSAGVFADVVETQRIPTLIRLAPNLYALAYRLMKMVPARYILRRAEESNRLDRDTVVVETTSGTFGLALAMQCAIDGRPLILVSDPVIDERLRRQLEDLGAAVEIVRHQAPVGGYQATRLAKLAEIQTALPNTFCPRQYSNPDNPASYAMIAELLTHRLGQVDCLIGPVGSGGSMCGTTRYLRQSNPDLVSIAIDAHRSVLFGQPDGHRALRGLGNSLRPDNLDHTQFDEVHWVTAAGVFHATRRLHRTHALFMGPTSGASYLVGSWWAGHHPGALTVIVLPDEGHRYNDTVYDDAWLATHGREPRPSPRTVSEPREADESWCRLSWRRRSLADVTAGVDLIEASR